MKFNISEHCYAYKIKKLSRIITKIMDREFIFYQCKLNYTQFVMLLTIQENPTKPSLFFSKQLGMDRTTFTRNINSLVRVGSLKYIEKTKSTVKNKQISSMFSIPEDTAKEIKKGHAIWTAVHLKITRLLKKEGTSNQHCFDINKAIEVLEQNVPNFMHSI